MLPLIYKQHQKKVYANSSKYYELGLKEWSTSRETNHSLRWTRIELLHVYTLGVSIYVRKLNRGKSTQKLDLIGPCIDSTLKMWNFCQTQTMYHKNLHLLWNLKNIHCFHALKFTRSSRRILYVYLLNLFTHRQGYWL